MSELKEATIALGKIIEKDITIDKTGVATTKPGLYLSTLPEGLTGDTLKQISDHNTLFAAASAWALGEAARPFLKKHADVDHVALEIPTIGKDKWGLDCKRTVQTINPRTKESLVKYGAVTVKLDFYGTSAVGELRKVKLRLSEEMARDYAD